MWDTGRMTNFMARALTVTLMGHFMKASGKMINTMVLAKNHG
jgi:hypothetical protein